MDEKSFAYWLHGYFELTDSGQPLSVQQTQIIRDHLDLVFNKVTPNRSLSSMVVEDIKRDGAFFRIPQSSIGDGIYPDFCLSGLTIASPDVTYTEKPISC